MSNFYLVFIITFLSGLSTIIGAFIIYLDKINKERIISISLSLSSIIMIYVSVFDLLPNSYNYISKTYETIPTLMLIIIYMLFGILLVYYVNSKTNDKSSLYRIGLLSAIALIIHNIPEGIITFISSTKNLKIGLHLALSIALHNIPEGMAISVPIYYSTNSKKLAFLYTSIAALSEPVGGLISFLFINTINDYLFAIILSFTAGIMIYLSKELIIENIKRLK